MDRDGSLINLPKFKLMCTQPNLVISQFKLQTYGYHKRYAFKCCPIRYARCTGETQVQNTSYSSDGKGNIVALEPQGISCGKTDFIHGFALERDSAKAMIRYQYSCCSLPLQWSRATSCYTDETVVTKVGDGKTPNLRMLNVQCRGDYALSFFQLKLDESKTKMAYTFRCCKFAA